MVCSIGKTRCDISYNVNKTCLRTFLHSGHFQETYLLLLFYCSRLYLPSVILLCFVFPVWVPMHFWGESFSCALYLAILRYVVALNVTWTVNSLAHMYGNKPYDAGINPSENFFVAFGAIGEGFHNYHHVFPSDYSTSEFGWYVNATSLFLDSMALIGQVTDRKKMSYDMVFRRKQRTGDGTEGFVMSAQSTRNKTE